MFETKDYFADQDVPAKSRSNSRSQSRGAKKNAKIIE